MKKIILIFLFLISSISSALACDIKIIPFGSEKEKIKLNPLPENFPDQFQGESIIIPIQEICKNNKELTGTMVSFLFIDNQLLQISLIRANMNDAQLMNFAMKQYGEFPLPSGIKKENFRGNYVWEKGNENINYVSINIQDGSAEFIEITNDLYLEKLHQYNQKVGEWLDSQK